MNATGRWLQVSKASCTVTRGAELPVSSQGTGSLQDQKADEATSTSLRLRRVEAATATFISLNPS